MPVETDILPPRYRGPRLIAQGGMGEVYRATDDVLGRAVAIKRLAERFSADEEVRARFTREALAAARLSGHPHAVTIFDVGEWNDRPFIVMEYLPGGSLADRLRVQGAQPPERVLPWLEHAAAALDAAHRNGIVHRDVKPANLLLDRDDRVRVADFGVASAVGMHTLTSAGTVLGTAGYLSPEQARGEPATAASDRYGLAVTAFELLAGNRPFQAESPTAEASAHVNASVPSVCARSPALPCELDPVFGRALAKEPAARYPTCADFVLELQGAFAEAAGRTAVLVPPTAVLVPPTATAPAAPPARGGYVGAGQRRSRRLLPLLLVLGFAAAAAAGITAAVVMAGGDGPQAVTVVKTVAGKPTTVQHTVTQPTTVQPPPPPPAPPPPAPPPPAPPPAVSASGHALNDRAYRLMQAGDYAGALPLLEQAVEKLRGVGPADPYEGWANYNLGYTLLQLGRCEEALGYLHRSDELQDRHELDKAIRQAEKCLRKG